MDVCGLLFRLRNTDHVLIRGTPARGARIERVPSEKAILMEGQIMKMKNILAAALACCMMLCLCACGDPGSDPANTTSASEPAQTTAPVTETTEATEADDGKIDYKVKVVDESGNPLAGVAVQLCDEFCVFATTNEEGVAAFSLAEGAYHASVMALPEGYAHVSDVVEFEFEEGSTELTITLKAAE